MANTRLVALVAVLIFLSFPPTFPSKGLDAIVSGRNLAKLFRVLDKCFGPFNKLMDIYNLIQFLGVVPQPEDDPSASNTGAEYIGFYVNFSICYSQMITARMSLSSPITYLQNYDPSDSFTRLCCTSNLSCSAECDGDHFAETDTFSFHRGHLINVPYRHRPGNKDKEPTGFLSLSRSPYSLVWTVGTNIFTYNISYSKSSFTIGYEANTTALQSTKILTNPSHPDFYYVNLTQISIGNASYKIDPTSNSSNVILDTVITPTLLETSVYAKVKTELKKLGQSFMDDDNELELCFSNKPSWPNLTLFFPSGSSFSASAQMVLTPDSYVVTIEKTKAQCAAIFETEGASVIGIMAQINRKMVFDLSTSEPMLYFSKCPSRGPIAVPSMIMILILSLSVLLYLYFPV